MKELEKLKSELVQFERLYQREVTLGQNGYGDLGRLIRLGNEISVLKSKIQKTEKSKGIFGRFGASISLEIILSEKDNLQYVRKARLIYHKYTARIKSISKVIDDSTYMYIIDLIYEDTVKYLKSGDHGMTLLIQTHMLNVITAYKNEAKKGRKAQ